jgi:hypothetical protein
MPMTRFAAALCLVAAAARAEEIDYKRLYISVSPSVKRGYDSAEPPGRVLSPQEVVRLHAKKAFDDLDEEERKHAH